MGLRVGVVTGNHEPNAGGAWTFSETLVAAVKSAECSHEFVVLDHISQGDGLDERRTQPTGTSHQTPSGIKSQLFRRFGKAPRDDCNDNSNVSSLGVVAARERIDLVWLMKPWSEPLPIPYIATVWDLEHRKQPYFPEVSATGWSWSEREHVFNALLPRASMIITGTQAGKNEVVHYYRVNPANVMVIPLPVPAAASRPQQLKSVEIKEKYGVSGGFLLYPAQFWPHKNHVNLLRALRLLRDQGGLDVNLVLTGSDKGNLDHVKKEVADAGLSDRVFVLGFIPREDLTALYRTSTALVFPSYFGPDNFPPLEAFALGCPVVAANVPGALEQIGEGALLFDPSNSSDIAAKIESLCRTPSLREHLIGKGLEIAKCRNPQAYIRRLCSFLDGFETMRRCWGLTYNHP
jgi:glycosyltransferase involved in cell wall biosynthesis